MPMEHTRGRRRPAVLLLKDAPSTSAEDAYAAAFDAAGSGYDTKYLSVLNILFEPQADTQTATQPTVAAKSTVADVGCTAQLAASTASDGGGSKTGTAAVLAPTPKVQAHSVDAVLSSPDK